MGLFGMKKPVREPAPPLQDQANPDEAQDNPDEAQSTNAWNLLTWAQGLGVEEVVASALRQGSDAADFDFVRGIKSRDELKPMLLNKTVLDLLVDSVWKQVQLLQQAGASDDIASKFAGAIELSYSGLGTFFDGLEGVLGAPSPKVHESMATEHLDSADSMNTFVTDNYGIATTSKIEWLFMRADDAALQQQGLSSWPSESADKLPDRTLCRKLLPLAEIQREAEVRNEQLQGAGHTMLINEELIAARLYTGPVRARTSPLPLALFSPPCGVCRCLSSTTRFCAASSPRRSSCGGRWSLCAAAQALQISTPPARSPSTSSSLRSTRTRRHCTASTAQSSSSES